MWIKPSKTGASLPLFTLNAMNKGYLLPNTDAILSLSLEPSSSTGGKLKVQAMLPSSWNSGIPGPEQLFTLDGTKEIPYDQWTFVSLTPLYGMRVNIYVNSKLDGSAQWNTWNAFGNFFRFGIFDGQSFAGSMTGIELWSVPPQVQSTVDPYLVKFSLKPYTSDQILASQDKGLGGYWLPSDADSTSIKDRTTTNHAATILKK